MIHLYYKDNTNYDANGDVILLPTKCQVTAGINRTWQIDIEHPIDEEGRWKGIDIDAVIKTPSFNGTQLWRVVQRDKRDSGIVAVCDPIFYDAAHDVVFVPGIALTNVDAQEAIDILTEGTKYSGISNLTTKYDREYNYVNLVEAITSADNSFVRTWNAEVGFDNYQVQILDQLGGDYGVSVQWGKNLAVDGVSESIDIDGTVTRIVPVAYNGYTLPEKYVDSPYINDYPFPRIGIIQFDYLRLWSDKEEGESGDAKTEYFNTLEELYAAMRSEAQKLYTEDQLDRPTVNLEVEMVLIENTEEYKNYKDLEHVSIGDTVRCYNPRLGIDTKARVGSLVYDCLTEKTIAVEIGRIKRNYFDNVTSTIERVDGVFNSNGTVQAEKIQGFINAAQAQLRLQNTIAQRQDVRAIMYEDLDPNSPTYGALSIGTQGWQIANERTPDGRDWVWKTAATANGIVADEITTGTLTGINIYSILNSATNPTKLHISGGRIRFYTGDDVAGYSEAGDIYCAVGQMAGNDIPMLVTRTPEDGAYALVYRHRDGESTFMNEFMSFDTDHGLRFYGIMTYPPVYEEEARMCIVGEVVKIYGENTIFQIGPRAVQVYDGTQYVDTYTGTQVVDGKTFKFVKGLLVSVS